MNIRPIAFYLPQFHPIPENDSWWGKGFTEWTNVAKARPFFKSHYQPQLPADLGFYDLRVPEVRRQQADLARENGIFGFCYYHYWFNGRRILERPFQETLESGEPDFPFMLCWANENWTRIWDGGEHNILLQQHYTEEDDRKHIRELIPVFKDKRYIRIKNKPVFCIYRSSLLPDAAKTLRIWREEARLAGLELYLCRVENFGNQGADFMQAGFDAAIEFQPFMNTLDRFKKEVLGSRLKKDLMGRALLKYYHLTDPSKEEKFLRKRFSNIDFNEYVDFVLKVNRYPADYLRFPGVTPSWDNTA
ncbi:MAG TPA: glycoside hydrolase family 99-like domain-containing protein, partial [Puia sp.]